MRHLKIVLSLLLLPLAALAVGSVTTTCSQIGTSGVWTLTYAWIGDASTGSIPATTAPCLLSNSQMQGMRVFQVETVPGSPSPTASYSVTLKDANGVDYLAGTTSALSATAAANWPVTAPPILGTLTMAVTGNSVNSAQGQVVVFIAPGAIAKAGGGGGTALPASASLIGSNASSQPIAATGHSISIPLQCAAASGSGTAYTCTTSPSFTPADGDYILFEADVANTGSATLAVNGATAATIKKQGGGTNLVANDMLAGQDVLIIFDGTFWQMQGQIGNALAPLASPTFTGTPAAPTPAATDNSTTIPTTAYVTTAIANAVSAAAGRDLVAAATAAILPNTPTFTHVDSGVGSFFTSSTNSVLVVDGYTPLLLDRILVKNQATAANNGIYSVTQLGVAAVAPWIMTRTLDYDQASDMNNTIVPVANNGTTNPLTSWIMTSTVATVDTDAVNFTSFTPAGANIVTAIAPGAGFCKFPGASQQCASSAIASADINAALTTPGPIGGTTPNTVKVTALNVINLLISNGTVSISSGFGTGPSVTNSNGAAAFQVAVGTGGTATSGVIALPTAAAGWNCFCADGVTASATVFLCKQTSATTTTATIGNFNTSGVAAAWASGDILNVSCFAH